jgi:hypothetical protein
MTTLAVGNIKSLTTSPPVIRNSSDTEIGYFCRAWVNFNGTGTVAIRASGNVSSIGDTGTGSYSINFSNAMSDANYSAVCDAQASTSNLFGTFVDSFSTGSFRVVTVNSSSATTDAPIVCVAVFR